MRGYLGNSARTRSKGGNRSKSPDGNGRKRPRRKRSGVERFPDNEDVEVIADSEVATKKQGMNLTELKAKPPDSTTPPDPNTAS